MFQLIPQSGPSMPVPPNGDNVAPRPIALPPTTNDSNNIGPPVPPVEQTRTSPLGSTRLELFQKFFPPWLIQKWVNYLEDNTKEGPLRPRARQQGWKKSTEAELYTFIGTMIYTGMHKETDMDNYWSTDPMMPIHVISKYISRNRFQLVLSRFTYWDPNADEARTAVMNERIQEFSDHITKTSQELMALLPDLAEDSDAPRSAALQANQEKSYNTGPRRHIRKMKDRVLFLESNIDKALLDSYILQKEYPGDLPFEKSKNHHDWHKELCRSIFDKYGHLAKSGKRGPSLETPIEEHIPIYRNKLSDCKACTGYLNVSQKRTISRGDTTATKGKRVRAATRWGCGECDVALHNDKKCWDLWHRGNSGNS